MLRLGALPVAICVAAATFVGGRSEGSYELRQWALLGFALIAVAWILIAAGRRPGGRIVAAGAALAALGVWELASAAWGGLPQQAWLECDRAVLAGVALVVGGMLGTRSAEPVVAGVLGGSFLEAADILVRTAISGRSSGWFYGRVLDGPVGYHNAQGAVFAVALPLAVLWLDGPDRRLRCAAGVAATVLLAALLLTQSRGALVAAGVALAAQAVLARRLSLAVRLVPLVAAGIVLGTTLGRVDAALAAGTDGDVLAALRRYALWALGSALAVGLLGLTRPLPARLSRVVAVAAAAATVAGGASAAVVDRAAIADRARTLVAQLGEDSAPDTRPGVTRLLSLSLNGRIDAWRVAWHMVEARPVTGAGTGQFARQWTRERRSDLYIIQPHSLELEVASETGVAGFALFVGAIALVVRILLRRRRHAIAVAAGAALIALLVQASADWTWSFPGVVLPLLLVVGAAGAVPAPRRPLRSLSVGLAAAGSAALALALLVPYLADRSLARAASLAVGNPAGAVRQADRAQRLDPWDPATLEARGRAEESVGAFMLAAADYRRAATLSQRPWLDEFRAARAAAGAGATAARRAACRAAAADNPREPLLRRGPCAA